LLLEFATLTSTLGYTACIRCGVIAAKPGFFCGLTAKNCAYILENLRSARLWSAILLLAAFGMTDNKEKEIITALELKTPKEYS
jgi:hypothetical protein